MKGIFKFVLLNIAKIPVQLLISQNQSYSEAPIIIENGIAKSTQITVHFNQNVIDIPLGVQDAYLQDISQQFPNLSSFFTSLEAKLNYLSR